MATTQFMTTSRKSDVSVDGISLLATKWTVEVRSDEIDVTNMESESYEEFIAGYIGAMISVDAIYDATNNDFFAPDIRVGRTVALRLFAKNDQTRYFDFPQAVILTCSVDASLRDVIRYTFTARNQGEFTYPAGPAGQTLSGVPS